VWGDMGDEANENWAFALGESRLVDYLWASCTGAVAASKQASRCLYVMPLAAFGSAVLLCLTCTWLVWARCKCADGEACMHGVIQGCFWGCSSASRELIDKID
jgi:hypothetical protein